MFGLLQWWIIDSHHFSFSHIRFHTHQFFYIQKLYHHYDLTFLGPSLSQEKMVGKSGSWKAYWAWESVAFEGDAVTQNWFNYYSLQFSRTIDVKEMFTDSQLKWNQKKERTVCSLMEWTVWDDLNIHMGINYISSMNRGGFRSGLIFQVDLEEINKRFSS